MEDATMELARSNAQAKLTAGQHNLFTGEV